MTEDDDDITLFEKQGKKGGFRALMNRRKFLANTGQTDPDKSDPRMSAACTFLIINEGEIDDFDRDMIVNRWKQRLNIDSGNVEGARLAARLGIDVWESISRKAKLLSDESRFEKITESADFLIRFTLQLGTKKAQAERFRYR
jgi:hypothetical protein